MSEQIKLTAEQIAARSIGESYQAMLDKEEIEVPASLREDTNLYLGSENISTDRFLTREFHDLEVVE